LIMKKYSLLFLFLSLLFSFSISLKAQSIHELYTNRQALHPPPIPDFYMAGLCFGDTTHFYNRTNAGSISWSILNDKGDTLYTALKDTIAYYFKKRGAYNVCLTADNGHIATLTRTVMVDTLVTANFTYRRCINEFNNLSTCSDHFIWTLPGNVTSTAAFPWYQFKKGGPNTVKLVASKGNKSNTISKVITMTWDSLGVPDSTFTFKRHGTSYTFDFKAVDSLERSYSWNFGDRQFDDTSGYKVTHTIDFAKYSGTVQLRVASACSFTICEIDPFVITGIPDEVFLLRNAVVYPNPASDELTISITGLPQGKTMLVKLIDAKGETVKETNVITSDKIYQLKYITSSLPKGIYLVQMLIGEQLLSKKVVLQ
jgi:hypothetical protein